MNCSCFRAGKCKDCGKDLYAEVDEDTINCSACGTVTELPPARPPYACPWLEELV